MASRTAAQWREAAAATDSDPTTVGEKETEAFALLKSRFKPVAFDKDNLTHLLFLNSATNLRCKNYSYERQSFDLTNEVSAHIGGQISFSASITAGFAAFEVLKYILRKGELVLDRKTRRICDLGSDRIFNLLAQPGPEKKTVPVREFITADQA